MKQKEGVRTPSRSLEAPPFPVTSRETPDVLGKRNILLISYHFHPGAAIGAVRWTGMASRLSDLGLDVRVISAAPQDPERTLDQPIPILQVPHDTEPIVRVATHLRSFLRPIRTLETDDGSRSAVQGKGAKRTRWRREASALLAAPDGQRNWISSALRQSRELTRHWQPDVVVTSGPPHSSHLIGRILRQSLRVQWVADLRDPILFVPDPKSWIGRSTACLLERVVARSADHILTTSPTLTFSLRSEYPATDVTTIPNGVLAEELPVRGESSPTSVSISHVGSIYGTRDLTPVVRALSMVMRVSPGLFTDPPIVNIAGFVSDSQRDAISRSIAHPLREDSVRFLGHIPRDDALSLVAHSTASVVLAQDQHHSIPGKLYEAIAMGVPALVITEKDSSTWQMGRDLGAWVVSPSDDGALCEALKAIVRGDEGPPAANPVHRSQLDYGFKARAFLKVLSNLSG